MVWITQNMVDNHMKTVSCSFLFVLTVLALVTMASAVFAEPYKGDEPPPGSLILAQRMSVPNSRWVGTEYLGKTRNSDAENSWVYYIAVRATRGGAVGVEGLKLIRLDTGIWIVQKTMSKAILQSSY
jgi:hypothetical protein